MDVLSYLIFILITLMLNCDQNSVADSSFVLHKLSIDKKQNACIWHQALMSSNAPTYYKYIVSDKIYAITLIIHTN
jgi:hypothetical protein